MQLSEIKTIMKDTFQQLNQPILADLVSVSFNNRLTRTAGRARKITRRGEISYNIDISAKLWKYSPYNFKIDTIKHECCHSVQQYLNVRDGSHGPFWSSLMGILGLDPKPCFSFNELDAGVKSLKRVNSRKYYTFKCLCENGTKVNARSYNKIRRGGYVCERCNFRLNDLLSITTYNWNGKEWIKDILYL